LVCFSIEHNNRHGIFDEKSEGRPTVSGIRVRRDGVNPDNQNEDPIISAAGYQAVAPDAKSGLDTMERRRQMIQESKFLGEDAEHTNLVKGLVYAVLQKVSNENNYKEKEEEELESLLLEYRDKGEKDEIQFKTKL
ncbi:protein Red, partial [Nephila pilipes]